MTSGLKEWDKILVLINFEINQTVGLRECDQSKFLGVLVKWHMSIMPQTSNPKFDHWIGRMWWDIGVCEVWQQSKGWIVRNE